MINMNMYANKDKKLCVIKHKLSEKQIKHLNSGGNIEIWYII